jgi:hypothetical protein
MKVAWQVRLTTLLALILISAMVLELYLLKRRQAQTRAALALYRQPRTEGIYDALEEPLLLMYPDGATLEVFLKEMKRRTPGKKLPSGIPIYVDPVGLQEAKRTMESPVKRPESASRLTLGEHLHRVLEPLGLDYEIKSGFLMITSVESVDSLIEGGEDPYVKFRDVLR